MMKTEYRTTSVRAVICDDSRILVEWFAPKSISFLPGGTIEPNEDSRIALTRELLEEVDGIKLSIGRYLGRIGHIWSTSKGFDGCMNHFYEAAVIEGTHPIAKEAGRELRWIGLGSQDLNTLQPPKLRELLLKGISEEQWNFVDSEA